MTTLLEIGTFGLSPETLPKDGRWIRVLVQRSGWCRVRWDQDLKCWAGLGFRLLDKDTIMGWHTDPNPLTRDPAA